VLTHAEDYSSRFLDWLLQQFRKPRMEGLTAAMLTEVQAAEDALYQLYTGLNLNDAVGVNLDLIGALLQVPRAGYGDDVYRTRLRVEILILRSNGVPDDLIAICRAALTPGVEFSYRESWPASVVVEVLDPAPEFLPPELLNFLNRARDLGVRINLLFSFYDAAHTFTFSDDLTEQADTNRGFGDSTDPGVGGYLAGAYS